jgi:peptide/nickel transport system substrate-binding protein
MSGDYWAQTLKRRVSRRRALFGVAATTAGAAFLAACGGDDDDSGSSTGSNGGSTGGTGSGGTGATGSTGSSGLVTPFVDTTAQAVKGGVWQGRMTREPEHYDPQSGTFAPLTHAVHAYSRLLGFKTGTVFNPPDGSVEADGATEWEVSPDGLKVTLKLRQNMKLDERAPTNGRAVTVDDVKYSFQRFAELSPNRGNILNSVSSDLSVLDLTTPDDSTIVVDLAFPDSSILSMLAWSYFLNIIPVEAESQFDIKQDMRGSGPWMMTEYRPSIGWKYRRNPNWYNADKLPYLDGIDYALLTESAAAEAQFKAKTLWNYVPNATLVPQLANEVPDAELKGSSPLLGNSSLRLMNLSKLPTSPLADKRVRQAMAMLIDRDAMLDVFGNISGFEDAGIEVESAWHSHAPTTWPGVWLDPKGPDFGDSAKYFQFNPDEAAALLNAAGRFGVEIEWGEWTDSQLPSQAEILEVATEMLQSGGHFKINRLTGEYRTWYVPKYSTDAAGFEGVASYQVEPSFPDWNMVLWGMAPGARNDFTGSWDLVPGLHDLLLAHRDESDPQKRLDLAHDWQRLMAEEMPWIPYPIAGGSPGGVTQFEFNWPWLSNYGVISPWGTYALGYDTYPKYWYDASKDSS